MNSGICDCSSIIYDLIEKPDKYLKHVDNLIECCNIKLESWHSTKNGDEIGNTLCSKEFIKCLGLLYSQIGDKLYDDSYKDLYPLIIFSRIYTKHIHKIIKIDNDKRVEKLREQLQKYELGDPLLNHQIIEKIQNYSENWDDFDHNQKVAIYHSFILYIYASVQNDKQRSEKVGIEYNI